MSTPCSPRAWAKDQYRANKTAENGLFLALCSYLVFLVLGLTVVRPYFYAQTADADIAEQGIRYLTICCVLSLGMFMQVMNESCWPLPAAPP